MDEKSLSEEQDIPVYKELPKAKKKKNENRRHSAFAPVLLLSNLFHLG